MVKAMPAGFPARCYPQHRRRYNVFSKQQYHPVHRSYKFDLVVTPTHALGDGQSSQRLRDDTGQQFSNTGALHQAAVCQPAAFVCIQTGQFRRRHPAGTGKPLGGFGGVTFFVISRGNGRPAPGDLFICLGRRQVAHHYGQPARGGVPSALAMLQLLLRQALPDGVGQGCGQPGQGLRRQFLRACFKQQVFF